MVELQSVPIRVDDGMMRYNWQARGNVVSLASK